MFGHHLSLVFKIAAHPIFSVLAGDLSECASFEDIVPSPFFLMRPPLNGLVSSAHIFSVSPTGPDADERGRRCVTHVARVILSVTF